MATIGLFSTRRGRFCGVRPASEMWRRARRSHGMGPASLPEVLARVGVDGAFFESLFAVPRLDLPLLPLPPLLLLLVLLVLLLLLLLAPPVAALEEEAFSFPLPALPPAAPAPALLPPASLSSLSSSPATSAPLKASKTLLSSPGGNAMTNALFFKISITSPSNVSSTKISCDAAFSSSFFDVIPTYSSSGDMSVNLIMEG
mmetsp:Transcript_1726/g.3112  ORF Transcript_1726/g.3112 Transcript_1726/m.3112 type:complete len:201 (+) Transcript_1726:215-817(+)